MPDGPIPPDFDRTDKDNTRTNADAFILLAKARDEEKARLKKLRETIRVFLENIQDKNLDQKWKIASDYKAIVESRRSDFAALDSEIGQRLALVESNTGYQIAADLDFLTHLRTKLAGWDEGLMAGAESGRDSFTTAVTDAYYDTKNEIDAGQKKSILYAANIARTIEEDALNNILKKINEFQSSLANATDVKNDGLVFYGQNLEVAEGYIKTRLTKLIAYRQTDAEAASTLTYKIEEGSTLLRAFRDGFGAFRKFCDDAIDGGTGDTAAQPPNEAQKKSIQQFGRINRELFDIAAAGSEELSATAEAVSKAQAQIDLDNESGYSAEQIAAMHAAELKTLEALAEEIGAALKLKANPPADTDEHFLRYLSALETHPLPEIQSRISALRAPDHRYDFAEEMRLRENIHLFLDGINKETDALRTEAKQFLADRGDKDSTPEMAMARLAISSAAQIDALNGKLRGIVEAGKQELNTIPQQQTATRGRFREAALRYVSNNWKGVSVGVGVGFFTKLGAAALLNHIGITGLFTFAAASATMPLWVPITANLLVVGVAAAISSKVIIRVGRRVFVKGDKLEKGWFKKALKQGALAGAIGGTIGAFAAEFLLPAHALAATAAGSDASHADAIIPPASHAVSSSIPDAATSGLETTPSDTIITPLPHAPIGASIPDATVPGIDADTIITPASPAPVGASIPDVAAPDLAASSNTIITPLPHAPIGASIPDATVPGIGADADTIIPPSPDHTIDASLAKLLNSDVFASQPGLKSMGEQALKSGNAKDISNFLWHLKEDSFKLINGHGHTDAGRKIGSKLINIGVEFADKLGVHTTTAGQLFRDEAYLKLHGLYGTSRDIPGAHKYAELAGKFGRPFINYMAQLKSALKPA